MQGSNYTQSLKDQGLKTPSELLKVYDFNPMGGGRIIRDKLWFYLTYRQTGGERTVPGMWINKNAGNPNAWTVDFDRDKPAFDDNLDRNGIAAPHVAGHAAQQDLGPLVGAVHEQLHQGRRHRDDDAGSIDVYALPAVAHQLGHLVVARLEPPPDGSRLGQLPVALPQSRATRRRHVQPPDDPRAEQDGEIPNLNSRQPAGVGGGFNHHLIGALANLRASTSYVTGAHNMKFGYQGGFGNPSQTYTYYNEVILVRMQRRRAEPADPGRLERKHEHQDRPQPDPDVLLRTGSVDDRPADAAGRRALRPPRHQLSRPVRRRPGLQRVRARSRFSIRRGRPRASTGTTSPSARARRTTCSATARRRSSSTSASTWKPSRRPIPTST